MSSREAFQQIAAAMNAAIIGQETVVERLLIAFLADGHVLMEGLPGVAKTRSIKTLSKLVESEFRRVQFTPDLLPSDVTGSEIYREQNSNFDFQPGPIFGNLVLADEINRSPAKVQAALLEAMEERQVTVADKTHNLRGGATETIIFPPSASASIRGITNVVALRRLVRQLLGAATGQFSVSKFYNDLRSLIYAGVLAC
jgi:MoxR-like ATPase